MGWGCARGEVGWEGGVKDVRKRRSERKTVKRETAGGQNSLVVDLALLSDGQRVNL